MKAKSSHGRLTRKIYVPWHPLEHDRLKAEAHRRGLSVAALVRSLTIQALEALRETHPLDAGQARPG